MLSLGGRRLLFVVGATMLRAGMRSSFKAAEVSTFIGWRPRTEQRRATLPKLGSLFAAGVGMKRTSLFASAIVFALVGCGSTTQPAQDPANQVVPAGNGQSIGTGSDPVTNAPAGASLSPDGTPPPANGPSAPPSNGPPPSGPAPQSNGVPTPGGSPPPPSGAPNVPGAMPQPSPLAPSGAL